MRIVLAACLLTATAFAQDLTGTHVLNDNGGWCWFQDERARWHEGALYAGSVASALPGESSPRMGNIEVTRIGPDTAEPQRFVLHENLQPDDHAVPALFAGAGGRLVATYSKHGNDPLLRWRVAGEAGAIAQWSPEQTFDVGAGITYTNPMPLDGVGEVHLFHRGRGWDPNYLVSQDGGRSWQYGGKLLENPGDAEGRVRPYVKYATNGEDTVHFVTTQAHPRDAATHIYHGYIRDGVVHRSDGAPVRALEDGPVAPNELTRIHEGADQRRAWTVDLHLDEQGRPYTVFSVHRSTSDHRYHYARWDGSAWRVNEAAYAGTALYERESSYTGLAALDPEDRNALYISTDAHPETGEPLISTTDDQRHYEIFKGTTPDNGTTWKWEPVTSDSSVDNLRPVVPKGGAGYHALLWLRGTYATYTRYDLEVVAKIEAR